ncbi:hypothetical protein MPTK1_7g17440 [Marchantia polymorpha subsp. ruderalis]|uniref:Uncharacterized protein n=2 Tax=Marchantia polymorpha TaxID=3197 RepID=A0AAF6C0S1_MARPO|nr:hypothetical protein MARPO_0051s0081 [Marchantia polymorpha]BBN17855.1 hypothetical protein Mp_7g17440 [Marchantia polymorpha subsp. ruderalis]|eukprot:PTQ38480.1 hypothetical protein MARPO_0051s0081 [Marchantia polymorpha]
MISSPGVPLLRFLSAAAFPLQRLPGSSLGFGHSLTSGSLPGSSDFHPRTAFARPPHFSARSFLRSFRRCPERRGRFLWCIIRPGSCVAFQKHVSSFSWAFIE